MHRTEIIGGVSMHEPFGERLRKIRREKGIPQWKLAEKIGIS